MLSHPLLPKLRRLKLSGILDTLETRAAQASRDQLSPTEFLAILLDDELERREQTRLSRRVTEAGVDPTKWGEVVFDTYYQDAGSKAASSSHTMRV